ncbi:glutamine amidotransferase [Corynebacterium renale]|uniref:glutamine amidotransferase n=1 Tax=Corynebacterium renale TaxID=1724 RepID=UPI000DA40224|nr:glutamine amidotransferase [Corynebacterium renale]SQG64713.1 glutamine amidotransferase [Corynebacterium renale]
MRPFLLVSPRQRSPLAEVELHDFLRATGLSLSDVQMMLIESPEDYLPDLSDYAGVFVGGSPLNTTDAEHSEWHKHVDQQLGSLIDSPVPVLMLCYGMSSLAMSQGGATGHSHPEDSGPTEVRLTREGLEDRIFRGVKPTFTALTGHTENVTELPDSAVLLATGPTCPIQTVRYGDHVWACQFHAEMDAQAMEKRMSFFRGYGYFDDSEFEAIVAALPSYDTSGPRQLMRNFVALSREEEAV